ALSGLFAQGRAVDPERFRRPRKSRCCLFPEAVQRSLLRTFPRHHEHRGVINRLARSFAPDLFGRTRFRLQMEHGLDARLSRIYAAGSDLSPVSSWKHHLLAALRFPGALRSGAESRRSCSWETVAAFENAGR